MYKSKPKSWRKHADFIFLDILAMYLSYALVYVIRGKSFDGFFSNLNIYVLLWYQIGYIASVLLLDGYKNVLKRGYAKELVSTLFHTGLTTMFVIVGLYTVKLGGSQSRMQIFMSFAVYVVLSYIARILRKHFVKKESRNTSESLLVITTSEMAPNTIETLVKDVVGHDYHIAGLVIIDKDMQGESIDTIPVVANIDNVLDYACREWVDEVFFDLDESYVKPSDELMQGFLEMGITTHTKLYRRSNNYEWRRTVEHLGSYTVLTRAINMTDGKQQFFKRVLDICGGIAGCIICGIIFIFVAPIIYINSPGPVIYTSTRIGKNGRKFKFYKFRSMYLDADERKKEFMAQNRVSDGLMFKLDWDPRIIGNRELPDGTRKTGIGEFIRKTSLDEFPQFWNVLKGDMSLVGTRPPTEDEWEKYELHHRSRMAAKPGITGMWQVSGRSEITDFEEVVRLDREYISKWSFSLDIKILIQTVVAVLTRKGSM